MATNMIIPPIGSRGVFTFEEPFNTTLNNGQEYIVKGIRLLKEIQDSLEDPYTNIYQPVNLTEDDFKKDLQNNVPVIVLSNSGNEYYYIPANKLKSMPQTVGIKYQEVMLAINLGYLPISFDLDLAKETIVTDILATLGIESTVESLKTSAVQLVTDTEDATYKKLLETRKSIKSSYRIRYEELNVLYEAQKKKLQELEKFILEKLPELGLDKK